MRMLIGLGVLLVSLSAAVAEEPPVVSAAPLGGPVGSPMRIAPAIIGQPMNAPSTLEAQRTGAEAPPQLLIAPPTAAVAQATPPVQVAASNQ